MLCDIMVRALTVTRSAGVVSFYRLTGFGFVQVMWLLTQMKVFCVLKSNNSLSSIDRTHFLITT